MRDKYEAALRQIAALTDTGSAEHKRRFRTNGTNARIAKGWRVVEAIREMATDVIGSATHPTSSFCLHDRVRVRLGADAGHCGTVTHVGGDDGTYYGVKLDCHDRDVGYSEYELENANALWKPPEALK